MAIEIVVSAPNGAQCGYHEVQKLEVNYPADGLPRLVAIVYSWATEQDRIASGAPAWGWQLPGPGAPNVEFEMADALDIEDALITTAGSPFLGGVIKLFGQATLEFAKKKKLLEFKQEFTRRNTAVLEVVNLGVFDADEASQFKITQTVLLARTLSDMGEEVSINFTRADNTTVVLDLMKTQQLGLTLAEREQRLRTRKNELRGLVMEATSVEELEALRWDPTLVAPPMPAPAPPPAGMP